MTHQKPVSLLIALMLIAASSAMPQHPVGDRIFTPSGPRVGGARSVVRAMNGMVATSQPLASAAGLRILQQGGNAIDAAIAAAAVLCVVEPMMVSPGGDMFALVWDAKQKKLKALNASGRAPQAMSLDELKKRGFTQMPGEGIHTVTVPGAVDGWATLLKSHGTMTLAQVLQSAIEYAERGFPVSEVIGTEWAANSKRHAKNADFAATYLPSGKAPAIGEIFANKNLAHSLRLIATKGRDVFYQGELAEKILKFSQAQGGPGGGGMLTRADFAKHTSNWVEPISTTYRGHTVYELPPNNQGLVALQMLNILEGFELKNLGHNSAEYLHLLVEAKKLAFLDRAQHIADPAFYQAPLAKLLSKDYAADLRQRINANQTMDAASQQPQGGEDTVYLTVVDKDRNVVSFIQSIFDQFGSGLVAGDTGILLHNRGAGFSFDPASANRVEGGKRPFHTLIPAMVFKDEKPWLTFGVMGGDMQAQGHVQVLLNLIEFGFNVQQAGELPRFRHFARGLALESSIGSGGSGIGDEVRKALELRGHQLTTAPGSFGGYQAIMIDPVTGALAGGSDMRKDGCAVGW